MSDHQSVLLNECIEGLNIKPEGIYFDGTFGRGGHSAEILKRLSDKGCLFAIDKDVDAIEHAKNTLGHDARFKIFHASFADIKACAEEAGVSGRIDGILLDLGVSSPQLDNPERGFSFMQDGPLDMRMDTTQGESAADFVNNATAETMAWVFKTYGEERFSGRIARAIVEARENEAFKTTLQLAEVVKAANPKWERHKHPATRVFQAIRIHVNRELDDLKQCLKDGLDVLAPGGRLVVISFHSLEDRIVKQFMRDEEAGEQPPLGVPLRNIDIKTNFKRVGKAIKPKDDEVNVNVRARSAVLRIGEKIS